MLEFPHLFYICPSYLWVENDESNYLCETVRAFTQKYK